MERLDKFLCGSGAGTRSQVKDILNGSGRLYTCLKIDEVSNLGAARIRIRSLIAAIRLREQLGIHGHIESSAHHRQLFTKEMRADNYTILVPNMSPIHFDLLIPALRHEGLNCELLPDCDKEAINRIADEVGEEALVRGSVVRRPTKQSAPASTPPTVAVCSNPQYSLLSGDVGLA